MASSIRADGAAHVGQFVLHLSQLAGQLGNAGVTAKEEHSNEKYGEQFIHDCLSIVVAVWIASRYHVGTIIPTGATRALVDAGFVAGIVPVGQTQVTIAIPAQLRQPPLTATLQGTAGGRLPPRIECQLAVPYGRIMRILKWNVVLTPQRIAQARDWANLNCGTGNN